MNMINLPQESLKHKVVGIIPAAGKGSRLFPLPGSKELFPVGFTHVESENGGYLHPMVVSQYLIDSMITAGVTHFLFILSSGKTDIMEYYGSGDRFGVHFSYLFVDNLWGMPHSINQAFPWAAESTVVFGMPDTIITPSNSLHSLLHHHQTTQADLTLGLFQTTKPWRFGMVEIDHRDRVVKFVDKPPKSDLKYLWGTACWEPDFSRFLNEKIQTLRQNSRSEIVLSTFFQMAVDEGMDIRVLKFDLGKYIDIGNPDDLVDAVELFSKRK